MDNAAGMQMPAFFYLHNLYRIPAWRVVNSTFIFRLRVVRDHAFGPRRYRSRLMQKIGVHDVSGLVKFSIQHGLISLDY